MTDREHMEDLKPIAGSTYALAAAAAATLIVGLVAVAVPRSADALPAYAQQTGLACGRCHVSPAGGGPRTAFGNAFAANGHKVPSGAKPAKKGAGGESPSSGSAASPPPSTSGGGYYSSIVNPRFGYVPELGYSNALLFRIYPQSD